MLPLTRLLDLLNRALPILPFLPTRVPHKYFLARAASSLHSDRSLHGWRAAVCAHGANYQHVGQPFTVPASVHQKASQEVLEKED